MHNRSLVCLLALSLVAGTAPVHAQSNARDALVLANVGTRQITRRDLTARLMEYRGDEALDKMMNLKSRRGNNYSIETSLVIRKSTAPPRKHELRIAGGAPARILQGGVVS